MGLFDHAFFLCLVLALPTISRCQSFSKTIPEQISGGGSPIVTAFENATNITVVCEIFNTLGDPSFTSWRLTNEGSVTPLLFFFNGTGMDYDSQNFFVTGDPLGFQTTRANLTVILFRNSLNGSVLECLAGQTVLGNFTLRLIELPILIQGSQQTAVESRFFSFSIQQTEGFPTKIESFHWYFNGLPIIVEGGSCPNITSYPYIKFTDVNRTDIGNYTITVSHAGGLLTGSFHLDVQYGPEGVPQSSGPFYFLIGKNVTFAAFIDVGGNPTPNSSWSTEFGIVREGERFNTSILGQLTITLLSLNDSGNYTNKLSNMVDGTLMTTMNMLELHILEYPTRPRNLSVLSTGAEFVNISFLNPINPGTPLFTHFRVEAISVDSIINVTVSATSPDAGFLNDLTIDGLIPNTKYRLTLRALSTVEQLGVLLSELSEAVMFNTSVGAPSIGSVLVDNVNGNLLVSWNILHTGGVDLETIIVYCSEKSIDEDSVNPLSSVRECLKSVECMTNSTTVGPVAAGVNYSCLVTAENSIGMDELRTEYVLATTGIPSMPVIISVSGSKGYATITIRMDSFGVLIPSDFFFIVSVFRPSDTINPLAVKVIAPDSILNHILTIVVEDLSEGRYLFSAVSHNIFSPLSSQVLVEQRPNTTTGSTSTYSSSSYYHYSLNPSSNTTICSNGLSVGVTAGVISAVAAVSVLAVSGQFIIILLMFNIYKRKGAKKLYKLAKPDKDLTVLQLPAADDYKVTDRVYDKPENTESVIIDMHKNVAYDEVHLKR